MFGIELVVACWMVGLLGLVVGTLCFTSACWLCCDLWLLSGGV